MIYRQLMNRPPQVFPSGVRMARVGDVDVYLLTLESWDERVVVRLAGAGTERTRAEIARYEAVMEQWRPPGGEGPEGWPPPLPGESITDSLQVHVGDEAGTDYSLFVRTGGGTGTELLSEWIFKPGLPSNATTVHVTVTSSDGGTCDATFNVAQALQYSSEVQQPQHPS